MPQWIPINNLNYMPTSQFTIYTNFDTNAPTLSGTSGSLLNLLDACLVTGYGDKPGAGWTKPLSNTGSIGIIKQGSGSLCYLYINDTGKFSAGTKEASVTAYKTITDVMDGVVTGSYPMPYSGSVGARVGYSGSVLWRKSVTTDDTVRNWIIIADSRTAYIHLDTGDGATDTYYITHVFGDYYSFYPGDNNNVILVGSTNNNSSTVRWAYTSEVTTSSFGHFGYAFQTTGSVNDMGKHGHNGFGYSTGTLFGYIQYPNPSDGGLYITPLWVTEYNPASIVRGRMRGVYQALHLTGIYNSQQFSGSGTYAGKQFMNIGQGSYMRGIFEISNTVDTN